MCPLWSDSGVELSGIFRPPLADGMVTFAIDVGCLFHSLTLRAAILPRSNYTRTDGVGTFLAFAGRHVSLHSLNFGQVLFLANHTPYLVSWVGARKFLPSPIWPTTILYWQ